jgi:hypothetical protein
MVEHALAFQVPLALDFVGKDRVVGVRHADIPMMSRLGTPWCRVSAAP